MILRSQQIGLTTSLIPVAYLVFNLSFAFLAVPLGVLSDKIGRRVLIITGYLLFAVIYLGFGFARNSVWIWLLFIVYGVYKALTDGIQKAYISDLVKSEERGTAMGTFNAITGIAPLTINNSL